MVQEHDVHEVDDDWWCLEQEGWDLSRRASGKGSELLSPRRQNKTELGVYIGIAI